jgi:hypothetical protein
MALDGVPWAIGGDAEHGPGVARQLAYLAMSGKQGVVAPGDLKVVPYDVPGAGVKVTAGSAGILNRVASQEAYTVRNPITDVDSVKIGATGSSGPRSDLVILRVDNPNVDDNAQDPLDPVNGPYDRLDIISGVPAGTRRLQDLDQYKGLSAIELARIDLPASTGTVTSAMITDLRRIANPRTQGPTQVTGTLPAPVQILTLDGGWSNFPKTGIQGVEIPDWATHMSIEIKTTYRAVSGNDYFFLQAFFGADNTYGVFANQVIDGAGTAKYRSPIFLPSNGDWAIPAALRGTTQAITIRARAAGATGAVIATTSEDYFYATVTFTEKIA